MADALVGIGADLSALTESLKTIPNLAGREADKAIKRIERLSVKASRGVSRAIRQQARDNTRAQKAAERAAKAAAREAEKQADAAREAGKGLVELAGVSADKFDKLRNVIAGLATPMGALTVGVTAVGLAFVGAVAGAAALVAGVVELTRSARDMLKELEPLQGALGIEQATVDRITAANDALDAAAAAGKALAIALADRVAPAVEQTAFILVKLGLASGDALSSMGGGAELVAGAFSRMSRILISAISAPLGRLLDLVDVVRTVARATGFDDLADRIDGVQTSMRRLPLTAVEVGFEGIDVATRDYDEAARALIGTVSTLREAEEKSSQQRKKGADATREQAAADAARARALGKVQQALVGVEQQQRRAFEAALQAAGQPFVDQSEEARLGRLREALVGAANAARLTADEALQTQAALAQIDGRLNEIATSGDRAFEALQADLAESVDALSGAGFDNLVADIEGTFSGLDWGMLWARGFVASARDAAGQVLDVVSMLTGGALAALTDPAALLQEVTKGAKGANAMADAAIDFVDSVAENIGPFISAITARVPDIIVALAEAAPVIVIEMIKNVPHLVKALFVGIVKGMVALARSIAREVRRAVRDVVSFRDRDDRGGRRRRRRVSDTPGPIRVDRETTVAPGDYLAAARTPAGLRAQVGAEPAPLSVTTVIDVRDGPVRLGMAISTRREVDRLGVGRNSSGRVGVY